MGRSGEGGILQRYQSRTRQRGIQEVKAGRRHKWAPVGAAGRGAGKAHAAACVGLSNSQLHISCAVEKCCHQLNRVEGRRERRSGKLRKGCLFRPKKKPPTTHCPILQQSVSLLTNFRFIYYYPGFSPAKVLKLLISIQHGMLKILPTI